MSIRSFVFALDAGCNLGDHLEIKQKIENELDRTKGFLSGMYIQGKGFFRSHHAESNDDPLIVLAQSSHQVQMAHYWHSNCHFYLH